MSGFPGRRIVFVAVTAILSGCDLFGSHPADRQVERGDAARGQGAISAAGCGSCHAIPGVRGADGVVGPSLEHWSERRVIAGVVPNDPERLITWITVPQSIVPGNAMPNLGVTDGQARDMAAYLYTLH